MRRETAESVVEVLNELFMERGPVREILMDNGTIFRSEKMTDFLYRWRIRPVFRAAYRPSGNGIVERHHRTIKALAERGNISPIEAVYWYNRTPRQGTSLDSVPHRAIFRYDWRDPVGLEDDEDGEIETCKFNVGDKVWVKPPNARCVTQWNKGVVTGASSVNNLEVNGMPRHVLDVRRVIEIENENDSGDEGDDELLERAVDAQSDGVMHETDQRRSARTRRIPVRLADYELS